MGDPDPKKEKSEDMTPKDRFKRFANAFAKELDEGNRRIKESEAKFQRVKIRNFRLD